jgi:hypothetical protein
MQKFFVVFRVLRILGLLVASSSACNVYDSGLIHVAAAANPTVRNAALADASAVSEAKPDAEEVDGGPLQDSVPSRAGKRCGNGVVDANEYCDIGIASNEMGACPDTCGGQRDCTLHVVAGRGCDARCEDRHIEAHISGDGCCPVGASTDDDTDCPSSCGNGRIEAGESCDPPETCVSAETCESPDACQTARYSGDAEHCTARCTVTPVQACINGDGCCPLGCTSTRDSDCQRPSAADGGCTEGCETVCAGTRAFGLCWYLGAPGVSCSQACAARGGFDTRAIHYVGTTSQGGSQAACTQILTALGQPGPVIAAIRTDGSGLGCHVWSDGTRFWLDDPGPLFKPTATAPGNLPVEIACGCIR